MKLGDMPQRPEQRDATCKAHGAFVSKRYPFMTVWSGCPKCIDEERASQAHRDEEARKAEAKARWEKSVGEAGIPERFRDRSLKTYQADTPEQKAALQFALDYADAFQEVLKTGKSAIFCGTPGTGKTHLACGIGLRIMARQNATVLFLTVMRAIRRIKDTWSKGADMSESEAIASLVFPDLLILDEVGQQFGSETEKLLLFDVLNERYERRRPVLLLSNLTTEEIRGYLGERVYDRLREGGGRAIPFVWESYRGKA